jgi:hypothetical protein
MVSFNTYHVLHLTTLLPLLLVSYLDTLLLMPHLFVDLFSSMILSSTKLPPTQPSGVISFLFILGLTTHYSPFTSFSLLLCSNVLLRSTRLAYLLDLFLLCSYGSILFSPHLIFFWIHSFSFLPHSFHPPLLCEGGGGGVVTLPFYWAPFSLLFSTINIFIHKGISSDNLLLGMNANFLSALLKDSLHSIEHSTIHPSFTFSTRNQ